MHRNRSERERAKCSYPNPEENSKPTHVYVARAMPRA
jgi:hypothetical protein